MGSTAENVLAFNPEQISQEDIYLAQGKLGIAMEDFLRSDVGRYLMGCAEQEVQEVKDKLLDCNPHSWFGRRKIDKLKMQAQSARNFMVWCAEAIESGQFAEERLKELDL